MQHPKETGSQHRPHNDADELRQRKQPPTKSLVTKKEAADFYSVTERTFDRWLKNGVIPATAKVIIGGAVRFRTEVLPK